MNATAACGGSHTQGMGGGQSAMHKNNQTAANCNSTHQASVDGGDHDGDGISSSSEGGNNADEATTAPALPTGGSAQEGAKQLGTGGNVGGGVSTGTGADVGGGGAAVGGTTSSGAGVGTAGRQLLRGFLNRII